MWGSGLGEGMGEGMGDRAGTGNKDRGWDREQGSGLGQEGEGGRASAGTG